MAISDPQGDGPPEDRPEQRDLGVDMLARHAGRRAARRIGDHQADQDQDVRAGNRQDVEAPGDQGGGLALGRRGRSAGWRLRTRRTWIVLLRTARRAGRAIGRPAFSLNTPKAPRSDHPDGQNEQDEARPGPRRDQDPAQKRATGGGPQGPLLIDEVAGRDRARRARAGRSRRAGRSAAETPRVGTANRIRA